MEAVEKKVENQIQFWTLLGPFFVLLSITALLFKVSPHWYFPLSALIGIPLCVRWKMKGMAAALGCLFLLAGINSQSLELTDQYWHVGLSLAMAFSFIVLTLSLEESDGLVSKVQVESQSRLDNLLLLDEKWKVAEVEWRKQREEIEGEVADLTRESSKLLEEKQTFYKLAQLAKDELIQIRAQHEQLLQDLLYKKEQISQLHERLDENEQTIQDFVNSEPEMKIQFLQDQVAALEKEKEIFQAQFALAKEELAACQVEKENFEEERLTFQTELTRLLDENEACNHDKKLAEEEKIELNLEKESLENKMKSILFERNELEDLCAQLSQQKELIHTEKDSLKQEREILESMKSSIIAERKELETLRAEWSQQKEGFEEEKASLKQEQNVLESIKSSVLKERNEMEILRAQCSQQKERIEEEKASLKQEKEALDAAKATLEAQLNDDLLAKEQAEVTMRRLEEDLKATELEKNRNQKQMLQVADEFGHMEMKLEQLSFELSEKKDLLQQADQEKEELIDAKKSLEESLRLLKEREVNKENEIDSTSNSTSGPGSSSDEARSIELMYKQLKKQFQEKSEVLDQTRRELFAVNEELLRIRRQSEEDTVYSYSKEEKQLQRYVVQLGRQFEQMKANYQQEIDDLMQLISNLLGEQR